MRQCFWLPPSEWEKEQCSGPCSGLTVHYSRHVSWPRSRLLMNSLHPKQSRLLPTLDLFSIRLSHLAVAAAHSSSSELCCGVKAARTLRCFFFYFFPLLTTFKHSGKKSRERTTAVPSRRGRAYQCCVQGLFVSSLPQHVCSFKLKEFKT